MAGLLPYMHPLLNMACICSFWFWPCTCLMLMLKASGTLAQRLYTWLHYPGAWRAFLWAETYLR